MKRRDVLKSGFAAVGLLAASRARAGGGQPALPGGQTSGQTIAPGGVSAATLRKLKTLRSSALTLMAEHHVPGLSLGLIVDGQEHYLPLGITSVTNPLKVTPDTLFLIASVTKTFTASAAMLLVQRGQLALDAPVRRYIPGFRVRDEDVSARVTVRHLLTHTSGWQGDYGSDWDTGYGDDALERFVMKMADLPQVVPLGALAMYSNSAFCLLGRVVEVVHGKPLDASVRELLLAPLGLHDTVYWAHEALVKRSSVGHRQSEQNQTVVNPVWGLPRFSHADGALASSARNLMSYARFHMGQRGDNLLSSQTRQAMQTPGGTLSSKESLGLCWFITSFGQGQTTGHSGDLPGFHANLSFQPERKFAVCCLTNSEGGSQARTQLTALATELFLGFTPPVTKPLPTTAAQLREYAAWYALPTGDPQDGIEVSVGAGTLSVRIHVPTFDLVLPAMPLVRTAPDTFVLTAGPLSGEEIGFVRDGNQIKYLRASGRVAIRGKKP